MKRFKQAQGEEPFSANAIAFLNSLSLILNNNPGIKKLPELVTLAFFCRKAHLIQLKKKYYPENTLRYGRGLVFHITPSNMPLNFAYSLICGILSGNANIVRLPSKEFEQVDIVCNAICELSKDKKYQSFSKRLILVRYDRQSYATTYFSSICDVRIIWGGDATMEEIRKCKLSQHAFDVTFADRYSLCVINANVYVNEKLPKQIALGFYNDTYLFDQNACTSPHLIVWLGDNENVEKAKKIFWDNLYDLVKERYTLNSSVAFSKLTTFYNQAVQLEGIKKTKMPDNLIWRVELKNLEQNIDKYRGNCGYFSEYKATSLNELSKIINRKYQTLSYYGIENKVLIEFITKTKPSGIDRIVPIGKTSDFSLSWDGYNLIERLSREIDQIV